MAEQYLDIEGLRRVVADLVEEPPESIAADANLFALGLDSIALMHLVGSWRQSGIEVNFAELAENPTISAWSAMICRRTPDRPDRSERSDRSAAEAGEEADGDDDTDGEFPLAVLQHAYWIGRGDGQRLGRVAAHLYTEFDGTGVEPDRLRRAVQQLIARHGMLRVRVTDEGRQRIGQVSGWRGLTVHDLHDLDDAQLAARLASIRETLSHQLLDVEHGEVICTELSLLPEGRTRLHIDVDMLAADAVSYRVLLADLARLYAHPDAPLPPLEYSYPAYRAARPEARRAAAGQAAEWWRQRLPGLPGAPGLPVASATGPEADTGPVRVSRRHFRLAAAEHAALTDACRRRGVTPAMALATVFAETLGAWSTEPRFLLNVPLFDREPLHPDVGRLVGDFTSSVLLEVDLTEPAGFGARVRQLQARMHADAAHADYTGVEVLRDLTRRSAEQVLAPVVFTSALSLGELFDAAVRRNFGAPVWIISQGPQVLLDAQVTELDGGLLVNWDVRDQEFADGVVDAMFTAFEQLVHRLAGSDAAWDEPVADLLPAEQRAVRDRINDTAGPRSGRVLHEGFFAAAGRAPRRAALLSGDGAELSYGELADRALRVGAALRARGVQPGDPVGIALPKGPGQAVAALGVLAAGGVYVPVGVDQPTARAERIARVAGFRVVLADDEGITPGAPALSMAAALSAEPLAEPVLGSAEQTAYILFTSGSTGEPKGVQVPHRAAMNTIDDLLERFELGPADRTLGLSALEFDLSVFDLFAPLSVGGAVVLIGDEARREARHWAELIRERDVTVLNCVPALLDMLLSTGAELGTSLRLVLLGGDRVPVDLPARLAAAAPGCRFVALGGTTETAIHSTVCEVRSVPASWRCVPYGTPLRNVVCRVVDHLGRDCPDWVPGELWIGGLGVAQGYRGDPGRTTDRFLRYRGTRWYRTGDQARYWPDGTIEFLGRRDNQVKIRGFRVELGEVEAALLADGRVQAAVAALAGTDRRPALVAAVVADQHLDPEEVRDGLRRALPAHMVPERVFPLPAIPLTGNGKVDRRAVRAHAAALGGTGTPGERVAPRSALERAIALVWTRVLAADDIAVTDQLFALGGDSVQATAIVAGLREGLDTAAVSVRMLFAEPTVAGLADRMLAAEQTPGRLERVAEIFLEIEALSDAEVESQLDRTVTRS